MREILTLFLPIYFLLFFGFAFLWRTWKTYRLTGVNPYRLLGNPGPEEVTSRYFRLLPYLSLLVMVVYLLLEQYYEYLAPFHWLHSEFLQTLGIVIMSTALAITLLIMMLDLALIQLQIRLEEQHLAAEHGEAYKRYCDDVRRWC